MQDSMAPFPYAKFVECEFFNYRKEDEHGSL